MPRVLLLFLTFAGMVIHGCAAPIPGQRTSSATSPLGATTTAAGSATDIDRVEQDLQQPALSFQGMVVERQENRLLLTIRSDELFEAEATLLKPGSEDLIGSIAEALKKQARIRITVHCHTDSTGSEQVNLELSEKRAKAVKEALVRKGLESSRVIPLGHGEQWQITSNATENGRQMNRRITLEISPL